MTVTMNEAALRFLLDSESGPVGRDIRRRVENVGAIAALNASGDIIGIRSHDMLGALQVNVVSSPTGVRGTVSTSARHRGFAYPAYHDRAGLGFNDGVGGQRPWLSDALKEGFDL